MPRITGMDVFLAAFLTFQIAVLVIYIAGIIHLTN